MRVDVNCDMGESFGAYSLGLDAEVMPEISSANVACGFHAGDPQVMRRTVALAAKHGVSVGAHPGFPDLVGFGRRELNVTPDEATQFVLYQIGAIAGFCKAEGAVLGHVKAHGALYNMAVKDLNLARAIAAAVKTFDPALVFFALPGSQLEVAGREAGLKVALEVFGDRAYNADGTLVNRRLPGAVIHDSAAVAERVKRMVLTGKVTTIDGQELGVRADTICVHGDTPGAVEHIRALRSALVAAGVEIKAPRA